MTKISYIKYLLLLSLFLLVLLPSCFLLRGSGSTAINDNIRDVSLDFVASVDSIETLFNDVVADYNHSVVLTSANYMTSDAMSYYHPNNALRIVEIKNTKVINMTSGMSEGRVVYKIPEKMKIRDTYRVLVRIAKSKSTMSIYDSLKGTVRTSVIPITSTMEAKLIDPSPSDHKSFEIVTDNEAVQIIEDGETYTEWSWNVTPIRVGNSNLKIVISIIRDGNKKDVVYEDSVEVEKDLPNQISFFFFKYWQWLLSTLIVPFGVWLYKKKKGEKEEDGKPKKKKSFFKRKRK
mgnify:CR=1 FL=1